MVYLTQETTVPQNRNMSRLNHIRQRMARALIGQVVSLTADRKTIVQGVVTDVLAEPEIPKIVVDGKGYNFDQILTHVPAAFSF